ncbi:hypothetical protein A5724_15845 [Mycobacterium sp. ACS1612]|uniref:hypothetical protein n=1 Tax=Mycobacterium sp. ACS1612 TaxID=1834117 RepID=UPI0007FFA1B9|nr:hypothetical protein [Mycobacterium sp. ACS1612]OBF34856.1 hypothetical protein A5724_15845 [Mycobacterium sp. ACS1612]
MLPIDPTADPCRRAWLPCPNCDQGADCVECQSAANCASHWQYLLSSQATVVHLQCPNCATLWSTDTRKRTVRRYKAA